MKSTFISNNLGVSRTSLLPRQNKNLVFTLVTEQTVGAQRSGVDLDDDEEYFAVAKNRKNTPHWEPNQSDLDRFIGDKSDNKHSKMGITSDSGEGTK